MKKITLLFAIVFSLAIANTYGQAADQDKKPAIVFVENGNGDVFNGKIYASTVRGCLLYTSPSPRDATLSRMPSSA